MDARLLPLLLTPDQTAAIVEFVSFLAIDEDDFVAGKMCGVTTATIDIVAMRMPKLHAAEEVPLFLIHRLQRSLDDKPGLLSIDEIGRMMRPK